MFKLFVVVMLCVIALHACAADTALYAVHLPFDHNYIALVNGSDGSHVIQADKRVVEEIGIVKYDLLGVKTLNIVEEASVS